MVKSKVKYIQSLSQKKQRDEDGVFIAEGPKIINEFLQDPDMIIEEIYALEGWILQQQVLLAGMASSRIITVDEDELKKISFLATPNQALAVLKQPSRGEIQIQGRISIMADAIQDPGNLGTIIRCADWFGAPNLICNRECADLYNPRTVQASMGSIARVHVIYEDLSSFIAKYAHIPAYAASLNGKSIYETGTVNEGFIVIGNESRGIHPELLAMVQHKITIPGRGSAESLNAAVAAGIILSHLMK